MRKDGSLELATWARTISRILYFLFAISLLRLFFTRLFNIDGVDGLENLDRLVWLSVLGYTFTQMFLLKRRDKSRFNNVKLFKIVRIFQTNNVYPIVASLILFASSVLMAPIPGSEPAHWYGFGLRQGFVAMALVFAVYHLQSRASQKRFLKGRSLKSVLYLIMVLQVIWYLPLLISPVWGLMDGVHSTYAMNDLVAPANGSIPLIDYAAQYSSLFGFPIQPLANIAGANFPIVTTLYLSLLTILTFLILIISCKKVISPQLGWLCVIVVIPITLTTAPSPLDNTSITGMFSAVPLRTLPIVMIGAMLISLTRRRKKLHTRAFF